MSVLTQANANRKTIFGSMLPRRNMATLVRRNQRQIRKAENNAASLSDEQIADRVRQIQDLPVEERFHYQNEFAGFTANAVTRGLGFRLHDVQILAIAAGVQGAIVEMQTGEGKTVVTGSVAAVLALTCNHVHVGTTNDYLAQRDREYMQPVWDKIGISNGLLSSEKDDNISRSAYRQQITYGPGYQFGFDYLSDQIYLRENRQSRLGQKTLNRIAGIDLTKNLVQSWPHEVILIDEADSVMIDEAMTPLVISGGADDLKDPKPFLIAKQIADSLQDGVDYEINDATKEIKLSDQATKLCHIETNSRKTLGLERPWVTYITNAIRANRILRRNTDYVVEDGAVAIVDQNTGRIFADRSWQDGLHQAVECKEGLEIKAAATSHARVTRQRYLELYDHLAGFTGTASAVAAEFRNVYSSDVFVVPTNVPSRRTHLPTRFFADADSKLRAIATSVTELHQTGQPILLGARTINESEQVRDALRELGLNPRVLNGIQHESEADIVAEAGHFGSITIATNMAGRGTDIKPDKRALELGGLHVIGISPNFSTRIDRQLAGRSARQGDPGSCQFFAAADDEAISAHAPILARKIRARAGRVGECKRNFSTHLAKLQHKLEQTFGEQRRQMVLNDRWMDKVRETFDKENDDA